MKNKINKKEDKESIGKIKLLKTENKGNKNSNDLKSNQLLITQINKNKKKENKNNTNSNIINGNYYKNYETFYNNNNYPNFLITNYQDKRNKPVNFYRNSNSYHNYNQKNYLPFDSLQKISITVDGSNKITINPNLKENNKNEKDIVNNVKNILANNNKKSPTFMPNKTAYNGFPKIVTNKGEQVIYTSRPIFHQNKFVNYTSPNVIALNHSIQKLYGNKFKKTNQIKPKTVQNLMANKSDLNLQNKQQKLKLPKNNEYEMIINNQYNNINEDRINTEIYNLPSFNDIINKKKKNDKQYSYKQLYDENTYYNLMINMDKKSKEKDKNVMG